MTKKSTYSVPFRRRREEKTNYKKRLAILKSNKLRFVVRKSNNNTATQIIRYKKEGDETIAAALSNELKKFGWKMHKGNIPAAYLTGFLCGLRAKEKNVEDAILDIGLNAPIHGSIIFAAEKGAVDAGIRIAGDENVFPAEERLTGKHISEEVGRQVSKTKEEIIKKFKSQVKKDA